MANVRRCANSGTIDCGIVAAAVQAVRSVTEARRTPLQESNPGTSRARRSGQQQRTPARKAKPMTLLTSTGTGILTPEDIGNLIVQPVARASVGIAVSTPIVTHSHQYRFPIVSADPSASWVAEGAEIPVEDADIEELLVTPSKVAGLTVISRELALDSSPEAQAVVGDGLARDIAKKVDVAFFGSTTANGPAGLDSLSGVTEVVTATTGIANLDPFAQAISESETVGGTITAFVASPATVLALSTLKQFGATASNVPLITTDPTQPSQRLVLGVPLIPSPAVSDFEVWALPRQFSFVVQNDEPTLDVDASPFFTSDRIAVRATLRVGFGWPHPASVVKITITGGS